MLVLYEWLIYILGQLTLLMFAVESAGEHLYENAQAVNANCDPLYMNTSPVKG